ncbi:MAG: putative Ca2+-binding hemolysin, partial [Rhodocyclaceae bacterium]
MTTTIDYALMAGHAYRTTRDKINWIPAPQGWTPFFPVPDPTTAAVFPVTSGFEAVSFQSTTNPNEIVISYAGTDPGDLFGDWAANLALAGGVLSDQLKQAADYYLAVKASAPTGATVILTGHSLGGGLASLIAVMFGESAVTFDQAPFLNSARMFTTTDGEGNTTTRSVAQGLRTYLADHAPVGLLAKLDAYILANDPQNTATINPTDTLAARGGMVRNINVQGEALTSWPVIPTSNRIGSQDTIANSNAGASGIDLHSQTLLAAFLQSGDTPTSTASDHTLGQVSFKLTELLKMIFDKNLFAYTTAKSNATDENFLEHIVRHQTGNVAGVAPTGDAMVARFTRDLWKIAQDNGLTLTNSFIARALTAFAMQMYYEDTANAKNASKELFTAVTGGLQFDMADVAKAFKTSFDQSKALDLDDAKGGVHFKNYIETAFTERERQLINSLLPLLRDWYIQAGATALNTTDTQNRNAFLLGGSGSDGLVGGTGADLLIGNGGADLLQGKGGNDVLLGGSGDDTYVYTTGDGLDTILDTGDANTLAVDGDILTGGAEYGDSRVHRSADGKHLYVETDGRMLIDGNLVIQNYATGGSFGLTMTGVAAVADPQTTGPTIVGDPLIRSATIVAGSAPSSWKVVSTSNPRDVDDGQGGQTRINDVEYFFIDAAGNPTETGGPAKNDSLVGGAGNDRITSYAGQDLITATQGGNDLIDAGSGRDRIDAGIGNDVLIGGADGDLLNGGAGDDRLYADAQVTTAAAIALGKLIDSGTGQQGDWLAGGSGADTLTGSTGNDVLSGGGGADLLIAGAGDDDILGDTDYVASSFDWTVTDQGTTRLFSPSMGLLSPADSAADVIYAGEGKDYVWAGVGNDVVFGEGGNDRLNGNEGNDIVLGGVGSDTLWGEIGSDYLDGGLGADEIQGGEGDDILIGGAENDTIFGGAGRDTYYFNVGDGIDRIDDASTGAEASILVFGEGFDKNAVKLKEGSLLLDMGNGDAVHIENWDQAHPLDMQSFASFQFADGSSLTWSDLLARGFDLDGTEGDDVIVGTGLADRIAGLGGNDVLYGRDGLDRLDGGAGNDLLEANPSGAVTLIGGTGQDLLRLHGAGNTVLYSVGDGSDVIETAGGARGTVLRLSGVTAAEINLILGSQGEVTLQIGGNTGNVLRFADIRGATASAAQAFDHLAFDDGSTLAWRELVAQGFVVQGSTGDDLLTGTDADERLLGGDGNDTLSGGAGNDTLMGGAGNDRYRLEIGTGIDTVIEAAGESSVVALGAGLGIDSLRAVHDGDDLVLEVRATGDRLRLTDAAASDWRIEAADGSGTTLDEFLARPDPEGAAAVQRLWDDTRLRVGRAALAGVSNTCYPAQAWGSYSLEVFMNGNEQEHSAVSWGPYAGPVRVQTNYVIREVAATGEWTTVSRPDDTAPVESVALSDITIAWGDLRNYQQWSVPDGSGFATVVSWNQEGEIVKATPIVGNAPIDWVSSNRALSTHYNAYVTTSILTSTLLTEVRGNEADNYIDTNNGATDLVDGGAGADILVGDGSDLLYGNDGDDRLFGTSGTQILVGGRGNNYLNGGSDGDVYRILAADGVDTIVDTGSDAVDAIQQSAFGISDFENRSRWGGRWMIVANQPRDLPQEGFASYDEARSWAATWLSAAGGSAANADIWLQLRGLAYYEPLPETYLRANDVRALESYYGTLIATDRAVLAAGVTPDNIRVSGNEDTGYLLIDMPDGTGLRVALAQAGDALGTGVELFEFADPDDPFRTRESLKISELVGRMNAAHVIDGTAGKDGIVTGAGADVVRAGSGDDAINAGAGNDLLNGGAGNDNLTGGAGDDVYEFRRGEGHDVISQTGALTSDHDVIRFSDDVAPSDVTVTRDVEGVHLALSGGADSIRILQQPGEAPLPVVEFVDGTRWDESVFAAVPLYVTGTGGNDILGGTAGRDILDGGAGSDAITGGAGDDVFVFGRGDGADTLYLPAAGASDHDVIRFKPDVAAEDLALSRDYSGLHITIAGTSGSILIPGQFGQLTMPRVEFADGTLWDASVLSEVRMLRLGTSASETLMGTNDAELLRGFGGNDSIWAFDGDDVLEGGDGNDQLYGGDGNDFLDGGTGNDLLASEAGDDVYLFGRGDGKDGVVVSTGSGGNDTLRFKAGVASGDVTLVKYYGGYKLTIVDSGDSIQFGAGVPLARVEFADGTAWDGAALAAAPTYKQGGATADNLIGTVDPDYLAALGGNDSLFGDTGNDLLEGGTGNDSLYGGSGNDVFLFGPGDGWDLISQAMSSVGDYDVVRFAAGIAAADVAVLRHGADLVISLPAAEEGITLQSWFAAGEGAYPARVSAMEFADGTVWDTAAFATMPGEIHGTEAGDELNGTEGNEIISGLGGGDEIHASSGNDILIGGEGDDYLSGGYGNDVYVFNRGDGWDRIYQYSAGEGDSDAIHFGAGISALDVTVGRNSSNDVILQLVDSGNGVQLIDGFEAPLPKVEFTDGTIWSAEALIQAAFAKMLGTENADFLWGSDQQETIHGFAGSDEIYGYGGDDTLVGGKGDDYFAGGYGSDVFVFNRGDGWDTVSQEMAGWDDVDVVRFGAGIFSDEVAVARSGDDLVLLLGDGSEGLALEYLFSGEAPLVGVEFADGTVWDAEALMELAVASSLIVGTPYSDYMEGTDAADTIYGLAGSDELAGYDGNDTLLGGAGSDELSGGSGDDILIGGSGHDRMMGGDGADTYVFTLGDGWDVVNSYVASDSGEPSPADVIRFGAGIAPDDVNAYAYSEEGEVAVELSFRHDGDMNGISIVGELGKLPQLAYDDGTVVGRSQLLDMIANSNGTEWDDALIGTSGADLMEGGAGHDVLIGREGNDVLRGGLGNDRLRGGEGNDLYVVARGDGSDSIGNRDGGSDLIRLGGDIAPTDVSFSFDGEEEEYVLSIGDEGDSIRIKADPGTLPGIEFADGTLWQPADLIRQVAQTAPVMDGVISDQEALEGMPLLFSIAAGTFIDADAVAGDVLSYAAHLTDGSPLPDWLAFDAATQTFSGTPRAGDAGTLALRVTATDLAGNTVSGSFAVSIASTNHAPVVANVIADQSATQDIAFSWVIPTGSFADSDAGDSLSFTATLADGSALPAWLGFDLATRRLSGTPGLGDPGVVSLQVTATDNGGLSVGTSFNLTVGQHLRGTASSDTLNFSTSNFIGVPLIDAGAGNDNVIGSAGNDIIAGGAGTDNLNGNAGDDVFLVTGTDAGYDRFEGGAGYDVIQGSSGDDTIRMYQFTGTATVEKIAGNGGNDIVAGTGSSDTLDF